MSYITTPDGVTFGTGDRIRAYTDPTKKFAAYPTALSGMQMKFGAVEIQHIDVTGRVIHVKGNHPYKPTRIWVYIEVESANPPLKQEPCNTKHPGVMESVFEYFDYIKIDKLIDESHLAEAFETPTGKE